MSTRSKKSNTHSGVPNWLILLLAVPFATLAAIISWPGRRRDKKKLEDDIHYRWIPEEKYLYLAYTKGTRLGEAIQKKLIPKFSKHLVIDSWNESTKSHVTTEDFEKAPYLMNSAFVQDYDGEYEAALVRINAFTGATLAYTTYAIDEDDEVEEVVSEMLKEMSECLDTWKQERHRSGLRTLLAKSNDDPYHPILNFDAAKNDPKAYAIMEGDWGGQVYLSVPMTQVKCDEEMLMKLLKEVDSHGWSEPVDATLYFEALEPGMDIPGGMDGGLADNKLWLHPQLGINRELVEEYLSGKVTTILISKRQNGKI